MALTEIAGLVTPDFTMQGAFRITNKVLEMVLCGKQSNALGEEASEPDWSIELDSTDANIMVFKLNEIVGGVNTFNIVPDLSAMGVEDDDVWHYFSMVMRYQESVRLVTKIDNQQATSIYLGGLDSNWFVNGVNIIVFSAEAINGTRIWNGGVDEWQIYLYAMSESVETRNYNWWKYDAEFGGFAPYLNITDVTTTIPSGLYVTPSFEVTIEGGVGRFTYLWSSDGIALTPAYPTDPKTLFSGDRTDYNTTETLKCIVTDTGNNNETVELLITTNITWEAVDTGANAPFAHYSFDNMILPTNDYSFQNLQGIDHTLYWDGYPAWANAYDGLGLAGNGTMGGEIANHEDWRSLEFAIVFWVIPPTAYVYGQDEIDIYNDPNAELEPDEGIEDVNVEYLFYNQAEVNGVRKGIIAVLINNRLNVTIYDDNGVSTTVRIFMDSDVLSHCVFTYDGAEFKAYHNSLLIETEVVSNGLAFYETENEVVIGKTKFVASPDSLFLISVLDEMKFYKRGVTQNEVTNLYNEPPSFSVDIQPSRIIALIDPAAQYTSVPLVATVTGGSGNFSYLWTRTSGSTFAIISGATTNTIQVTGLAFNDETSDVFKCEVTDLDSNAGAKSSDSISFLINWDAV